MIYICIIFTFFVLLVYYSINTYINRGTMTDFDFYVATFILCIILIYVSIKQNHIEHFNNYLTHKEYQVLQQHFEKAFTDIRILSIKVIKELNDKYDTYYPLLKDKIKKHIFNNIDMGYW